MNTFINKNGIIVITNTRRIQNVANIYGYIRVRTCLK
ncbi:recombinase, partial [Bacillus cereus]